MTPPARVKIFFSARCVLLLVALLGFAGSIFQAGGFAVVVEEVSDDVSHPRNLLSSRSGVEADQRHIESTAVLSATTVPKSSVTVVDDEKDRHRLAQLRSMLWNWMTCIDRTLPASAVVLEWSKNNACNFTAMTGSPLRNKHLVSLMSSWAVEAHGDSTLRELVKLWVGYFGLSGSLDKKDANAKLRDAKFFLRRSSASSSSYSSSLAAAAGHPMFRVMFRFDFEPKSFFDPFPSTVMQSDAFKAFFTSSSVHRVDGDEAPLLPPAHHVLLLSTASHHAKELAMNRSYAAEMLAILGGSSFTEAAVDRLFLAAVAPVEEYLLMRLLRLQVRRDSVTHEVVGFSPVVDADATTANPSFLLPIPRVAFFFLQTMECDSMAEAKLSGFREMSAYCDKIISLVHKQNDLMAQSFAPSNGDNGPLHRLSALRALNPPQRKELRTRTWLIPPLECHRGHFKFDVSGKRFCTKDGVHLRTKFIRLKLELVLQALLQLDT